MAEGRPGLREILLTSGQPRPMNIGKNIIPRFGNVPTRIMRLVLDRSLIK
jgi:hypothetical protein